MKGGRIFILFCNKLFIIYFTPPTHERISGAIIMHIIMHDAAWWVITHHPSSKNIGWG
jgi:MFS superfamily sulfate permease-like transporter